MRALVFLCTQQTTSVVPSFTDSKDMTGDQHVNNNLSGDEKRKVCALLHNPLYLRF